MSNFKYMDTLANFFLTPQELAIAASSSLIGGGLYGGTYVGTKKLLGEDLNTEQANKEIAANTTAGAVSGLGGYLITKALQRRANM